MRDVRRVILSAIFFGLTAAPAQAAPLLFTFEGTIPTLTKTTVVFTNTPAGNTTTSTTSEFLNVPVSGSFTFDSDIWGLVGGPLDPNFPLRRFESLDPANASGIGVETTELITGTLDVSGEGTLSLDRIVNTMPPGAVPTFPFQGSTSLSYLDGTEGLNVGPFEFGDFFGLQFANGFAWVDPTSFSGPPGTVIFRSQSNGINLGLSSGYNSALQLQDLFPAGPPLAFTFLDPLPGDCSIFANCEDGLFSIGAFNMFTAVRTLTVDGSVGVDTRLEAPSIVVHQARLQSAPEPATLALLTIGATVALRRRR